MRLFQVGVCLFVTIAVEPVGWLYSTQVVSPERQHEAAEEVLRAVKTMEATAAREHIAKLGVLSDVAVPALAIALNDPDAHVRTKAAFVLGDLGGAARGAVPTLVRRLDDRDSLCRYAVIVALGKIGPHAHIAVERLCRVLNDGDVSNRIEAARALFRIAKNISGVAVMCDALKDQSATNRYSAAMVLGEYGSEAKAAIPALSAALNDNEASVRVYAAEALWRIDERKEGTPTLLEEAKDSRSGSRFKAAYVLWNIEKHPSVIPMLTQALKDEDTINRFMAAVTLRDIGKDASAALPALRESLNDKEEFVRRAASQAIAVIAPDDR